MTDKQIIIDGVDVSGCEWFYKNDPCKNTCKYFCTPCERVEIQNCMYKYAKRKEQECEKLKEELNKKYIREDIKTYCPFFFRDTATCLGRDLNEIGQLKFCRKYHNCWIKKIAKENIQLKQTLTEIKEIVERDKEFCIKCNGDKEIDCIDCIEGGRALLAKEILQKISKCEGNDVRS